MARNLQSLLIDANAYLDLDAAVPTGTELTTRANYANQAVWEATAVAQFREFQNIYTVNVSSGATIPLPSGFREFMTAPRLLDSTGLWVAYEQIDPLSIYDKEPSDKYCYVLGNPSAGYTAVFNNLTANCTLSIVYQRYPSGLATLTDVCELPDPQYVVEKIKSFVLQSRRDERFPQVDAKAEQKLKNMVGRGQKTPSGGINQIRRTGANNYILE
jgi:hypothetical protein